MPDMRTDPEVGGFHRKIQLSLFIRSYLSDKDAHAHEIYIAYKDAVQSELTPDYIAHARRKIKTMLARQKRTKRGERVKISSEEIDDALPLWIHGDPPDLPHKDQEIRSHPPPKKRKCINYNGFMHYMYVMRQLGLITWIEGSEAEAGPKRNLAHPEDQAGPHSWHESHPSTKVHAPAGMINHPAWQNIWKARYPMTYELRRSKTR